MTLNLPIQSGCWEESVLSTSELCWLCIYDWQLQFECSSTFHKSWRLWLIIAVWCLAIPLLWHIACVNLGKFIYVHLLLLPTTLIWSQVSHVFFFLSFFLTVFIFTVAHAMFASSWFNFLWELCHTFLLWHYFIVPTLHILSLNSKVIFTLRNQRWLTSFKRTGHTRAVNDCSSSITCLAIELTDSSSTRAVVSVVVFAQVESKLGWKCIFFWVMLH